jgi:hypothetical protein
MTKSINVKGGLFAAAAAALMVLSPYQAKADLVTTAVVAGVVYAGERMNENNKSVYRETSGVDQFIRTLGPSMKDIRQHGLAGGSESVINKPLGSFGKKLKKIKL